jgi:FixJ family two-component response regulator
MGKQIILCVDDESSILGSLEMELSLKNKNYHVELAESGEEALKIAKELTDEGHDLTVVISDYIMPSMKGDELLVKLHKRYPLSKKILLTGQAALEGVTNVINDAILYRFIDKPWDRDDLRMTVQEAIRKFVADKRLDMQEKLIAKLNVAIDDRHQVHDEKTKDTKKSSEQSIEDMLYERELYDQLFFIRYFQTLNDEAQDWLSKAAIGIICADREISRPEKLFLEAILKHDRKEERVLKYLDMIKGNIQPKLEILRVDEETAFKLLDNLAWILVANKTIKLAEEKYFEFICSTVGVDDGIASGFLNMAKTRIKSNYIRHQTRQKIVETPLTYHPDLQPPTHMMKHIGNSEENTETPNPPSVQESTKSQAAASQIHHSIHNNSIKIRQFTCYVCDSDEPIQFNILDPKSQKPDHNIFGIPSYKIPNTGFEFINFNTVKLAICPSCYFTSFHKEHFRRKPSEEPPTFLSSRPFINFWMESIFNRQEKILDFDLNEYFNLRPSPELVETIYDFGIQVAEAGSELSEDPGVKWQEVAVKLTLAEILSERNEAEKANTLLQECFDKSRSIFETSYDLEYTYRAGRIIFYLALYFEDKKASGEMFDYFSRSVREKKNQSTEEEKLLIKMTEELKKSFEDRDEYSKKSLDGLHQKS